jgi:hypothetical protein
VAYIADMPDPAALFAILVFSAIGLAAFLYGRKQAKIGPLVLGLLLMIYPYFISETWILYAVGSALTVAIYFFRE